MKLIEILDNQNKNITESQLRMLEYYLEKFLKPHNIESHFSKHFLERANDSRNFPRLTIQELIKLFEKQFKFNFEDIVSMLLEHDICQGCLIDNSTHINIPFVVQITPENKVWFTAKTVFRKKNFYTEDPKFIVN